MPILRNSQALRGFEFENKAELRGESLIVMLRATNNAEDTLLS
jgi:hypothetical protein